MKLTTVYEVYKHNFEFQPWVRNGREMTSHKSGTKRKFPPFSWIFFRELSSTNLDRLHLLHKSFHSSRNSLLGENRCLNQSLTFSLWCFSMFPQLLQLEWNFNVYEFKLFFVDDDFDSLRPLNLILHNQWNVHVFTGNVQSHSRLSENCLGKVLNIKKLDFLLIS